MKRRGFLGGMVGAAVAGPAIAREAASQTLASLSIGDEAGLGYAALAGQTLSKGYADKMVDQVAIARDMLGKIAGITAAQRAKHKKRMHVGALDPDIAGFRSISLSAKIDMQKERQLNALIGERKTMWQRIIDGLPSWDDEDIAL